MASGRTGGHGTHTWGSPDLTPVWKALWVLLPIPGSLLQQSPPFPLMPPHSSLLADTEDIKKGLFKVNASGSVSSYLGVQQHFCGNFFKGMFMWKGVLNFILQALHLLASPLLPSLLKVPFPKYVGLFFLISLSPLLSVAPS